MRTFFQQSQPEAYEGILSTNPIHHKQKRLNDSGTGCGNPNKANGRDGMIDRVFSLCNPTATKPPSIMLQNCLKQNILEGKKTV